MKMSFSILVFTFAYTNMEQGRLEHGYDLQGTSEKAMGVAMYI